MSSYSIFGATITLPGETEAGSAGKEPCRGITWWAHRHDDRSVEGLSLRSSKNRIGSVDPDASKIPARRAESTLTEDARLPFHTEPGHTGKRVDTHTIQIITKINDKSVQADDLKVSADGQTL